MQQVYPQNRFWLDFPTMVCFRKYRNFPTDTCTKYHFSTHRDLLFICWPTKHLRDIGRDTHVSRNGCQKELLRLYCKKGNLQLQKNINILCLLIKFLFLFCHNSHETEFVLPDSKKITFLKQTIVFFPYFFNVSLDPVAQQKHWPDRHGDSHDSKWPHHHLWR